jgi:DNA-directed RNA polymerase subunit RPC12/RpoP
MKCINCGTDNNLKDRTANLGRCKNCHHRFAFEPTTMKGVKITDPFFAKLIADISINSTLFFNQRQLFYFLENRWRAKYPKTLTGWIGLYLFLLVWSTLFFGGFLSIILGNNSFLIVCLTYNILCVGFLFKQTKSMKLSVRGRKNSAKILKIVGFIILIGGGCYGLFISQSFIVYTTAILLGMLAIYLGFRPIDLTKATQEFSINSSQFQEWLTRWQQINGNNPKILPTPNEQILPATANSDVTAYSFDRLIVCDRAEIAQFLIANNFHFENNCAILTISGYPQNIFDTTMTMLRRNPDLKIYALHDCSPQGMTITNQLRTDDKWFANTNLAVIDIGITPQQILAGKRAMFIRNSPQSAQAAKNLPAEIRQALSPEEVTWLEAGNFVELESITPQKLIQILQRGIAGNFTLGSDDGDLSVAGDSGTYLYTTESFG